MDGLRGSCEPGCCSRVGHYALQAGQTCKTLLRRLCHEVLQLRALPGIIGPLLILKIGFRARVFPRTSYFLRNSFDTGFSSLLLRFGLFLLLCLFAQRCHGVCRMGYSGEGRDVAGLGCVLEAYVFSVVKVLGELLSDGVEFIFDHDVDIVLGEAGAHLLFCGRGWGRGGGGCSL